MWGRKRGIHEGISEVYTSPRLRPLIRYKMDNGHWRQSWRQVAALISDLTDLFSKSSDRWLALVAYEYGPSLFLRAVTPHEWTAAGVGLPRHQGGWSAWMTRRRGARRWPPSMRRPYLWRLRARSQQSHEVPTIPRRRGGCPTNTYSPAPR